MTRTLQAAYLAVILVLCVPVSAGATSRIKDLASIEGVRQNQLIGYGGGRAQRHRRHSQQHSLHQSSRSPQCWSGSASTFAGKLFAPEMSPR